MRIAVFQDFLENAGGAERVALTLAKHLDADLITTDYDPRLPDRLGFGGVNVISLGALPRRPPLKQIAATRRFARSRLRGYDFHFLLGNWAHYAASRHHPNAYYCLTPTRLFFDQRAAMLSRLSAGSRTLGRAWTGVHRRVELRASQHWDRIIAISENVRDRVRRYYGRDASVIYPPVATRRYRFKELGDFWLSVSRMYPEKRIDLQLEIFRRLPEERLALVGGHSAGDRAARYKARLNVPPNVTFLGEIPDDRLVDLYARCRGLLTSAVDEDFGITPLEAMASGKLVLATDEGGYRETIVHGRTGYLLPPEPGAFVAKIRELDEASLRSVRDDCVARAAEFDEPVFVRKMRALCG